MFRRILIANRGEVAVRIARAARELGASPVGVVSTADLSGSWVETMDEVVCVGGPSPAESYLRLDAVVQAALQTGCSAVHPGWGFLAEQPRFAALCEQHGLTFIGPRAAVMERMGLKWSAKQAARAAGLEVIPGSEGLLADADQASEVAARVGYPVILKADAGGGGRGMRLCPDENTLREAFSQASAEAAAAFGDGALYLERYLTGGRHVEVQLLADGFGAAVHLGIRECSIQRKHQKLIEESPSPALDHDQAQSLGRLAVDAARSFGYTGAGTIEFLRRADDGALLFLEMNTRLQVEHPVSEMVTGIDVVQAQIRIAANQHLGLTQEQVPCCGHAIECRINAEDPSNEFSPAPGRLETFELADGEGPGRVRIDTHLRAGDEISPHYDSLLAKVIAHGDSRAEALETMRRALYASTVEGVCTTIPFHLAVLASPAFESGEYDTASIPGWPSGR